MIRRRTHILKYELSIEAQPPYQDESGNWHYPDKITKRYEVPCRVESKLSASIGVEEQEDAKVYNFSYLIFLNTVDTDIPEGTEVGAVHNKTGNLIKGRVAFFSRDQRQCRIWV